MDNRARINQLFNEQYLDKKYLLDLLREEDDDVLDFLYKQARSVREREYGHDVYVRGLIEFSNYCKNDCYYCGIRCSNSNIDRYRLTNQEILDCCKNGYELGYRTFVLQGGEDRHYTSKDITEIVKRIHKEYPDCAITLSLGEFEYEDYLEWFRAGATRYLLRHETVNKTHYESLHPIEMSYEHRMNCLRQLKQIGYQVGAGFMVGSPGQTIEDLADELLFLKEFQPAMIGIGPFIAQKDTPFGSKPNGTLEMTCKLLALLRLLLPKVLLPATTALGTVSPTGREQGLLAGANVVMPNLSPVMVRKKYALYDNKICTGEEAAECRGCLERRVNSIQYNIVTGRGDSKM